MAQESKIDKGKRLLNGLYGGDNGFTNVLAKQAKLTALSELNEVAFSGVENPITPNNKAALIVLLEHPDGNKLITEFLKKPENKDLIPQIATIFKRDNKEEIDLVANAISKGDETKLKAALVEVNSRYAPAPQQAPVEQQIIAQETKQSPAQPAAEPAQPAPVVAQAPSKEIQLRQTATVDMVLTSLTNEKTAADILKLPGIKFDSATGRASIESEGQTRYFTLVNKESGTATTGLRASAWAETNQSGERIVDANGKSNLILAFPGYGGSVNDGRPETKSLFIANEGKLNPQTAEVAPFVNASIQKFGGTQNISGISIGSHSFGSSNAIAAQAALQVQGIPAETHLLFVEPVGATLAKDQILASLQDKNSTFAKSLGITATTPDTEITKFASQLNQNLTASTTIRAVSNDSGHMSFSGATMLRPGQDSAENLFRLGGSRAETIDPNNGTLGDSQYINVSGNNNISSSPNAEFDPAHMGPNLVYAFQEKDTLTTLDKIPGTEALQQAVNPSAQIASNPVLAANPEVRKLMVRLIDKAKESGNTALADPVIIQVLTDKDTQKAIQNTNALLKAHPAIGDIVVSNFDPKATSSDKGIESALSLITKPEIISQVQEVLDKNPNFTALITKAGLESKGQGSTELTSALTPILTNPERLGKLATLIEGNKNLQSIVSAELSKPASTEKPDVSRLTTLINLAETKPELVSKGADLYAKAEAFKTKYPQFAKFAGNEGADLSKLTPEIIETKDKQLTAITEALDGNSKFADFAAKLAAKGTEAGPNGELLLATLSTPEKIKPLASKIDKLLSTHPEMSDFILANVDSKSVGTGQGADVVKAILDKPETLDIIQTALDENRDLTALLTGKLPIGQVLSDFSGFANRNPTLLKCLKNPTLNALYDGSQFAKDNPKIKGILENEFVQGLYALFGGQPAQNEPGQTAQNQEPQNPLMALFGFVCSLFGIGNGNGQNPLTMLAGLFGGQSQENGRS